MDDWRLNEKTFVVTQEPLAGTSLSNLFQLLVQNRFHIDTRYIPRLLYAMTVSSFLMPFRIKEQIQYEKVIRNTKVSCQPLFILGHWRSGTTYLHNLLSLDDTLGYFTTFHATLPGIFLGNEKFLKSIVAQSLPEKRPMDDVPMAPELPQEDEFALAAISLYSGNHGLCFPKNWTYYSRFIFMDDVTQNIKDEWKKQYHYLIQKETLYRHGRRLILKNPANTARVQLILEMFPEAKFIHIYRNPYHVFLSMIRFIRNIVPLLCVQQPPQPKEIEHQVFQIYKRMYMKYFKEKNIIPKENIIEVRYEEFIHHPFEQLRHIYTTLNLSGFKESEQKFSNFIAQQVHVKKQNYILDELVKEKIYKEWEFAFTSLGYEK